MAAATAREIIALIQREQAGALNVYNTCKAETVRGRAKIRADECAYLLGRITAHQAEPQIRPIGPQGD